YYECLATVLSAHVDVRPATALQRGSSTGLFDRHLWDNAPHMRPAFAAFLQFESVNVEGLARRLRRAAEADSHLRLIRAHPIIQTGDRRGVALDLPYLADRASIGPLFILVESAEDKSATNIVFRNFGLAFERYVQDLIRERYRAHIGLACRCFFNIPLRRGKR